MEEEEVFLFAFSWLVFVAGLMRNVSQKKGPALSIILLWPASQQRPCFGTRAGQTRILSMSDVKASELGSPASGCRLTPFCGQVRVQPQPCNSATIPMMRLSLMTPRESRKQTCWRASPDVAHTAQSSSDRRARCSKQ